MDTLDFVKQYYFLGRSAEIDRLKRAISKGGAKLIVLEGGVGVGKTAIANRLVEMIRAGSISDRFDSAQIQSAYQENWDQVLSQSAEKLVGRDIVLKATSGEIQDHILSHCKRTNTLLVLDNLEGDCQQQAIPFFDEWKATDHHSLVLLTTRKNFLSTGSQVLIIQVNGLNDESAQLELLGKNLLDRFGRERLLKDARRLKGIPLELLFLRWLDPRTETDLDGHVEGLVEGTLDQERVLEDALATIPHPLTYFMALGTIRHLQFEERLLAFLWDRMGGGSVETYIRLRNKLVQNHLLIPLAGQQVPVYRISEVIHMQLNKALARRIGEKRLATVHFFASEYYRIVFESQENMSLEALDAFVYHCFASGSQRVRAAYEYLFDGDILTGLHNAGMALQLKGILQKLNENVEDFSPLQQCRLLIEMAHVNSDLSEFEESLELMKKAEATLEEMRDDADDFIRADLLKQIWYYSAIAYSNTGFSNECLRSYFKIISSASADNSIDRLACLCLAYFSHDLKYRDIEMALTCGAKALEIARMIDDSSLIAKSLCSLGETQLYTPDLDQADLCFEEANSLCLQNRTGSADLRERGRVLKNWGLVALIRNDLGRARERLEEAKRISASMGDRRRVASADLYLGILCYRLGDATEGNTYIASSVRALAGLGDGRYLVPAIMTYALINDPTYSGKRRELLDSIPCKPFSDIVSGVAESERFEVFARFWRDHFRPVVLGS